MSVACFFRYGWIAPDAFETLTQDAPVLGELSTHIEQGRQLTESLPASALRAGAISRLAAFARQPLLLAAPPDRLLRSAARWARSNGESEALRLVDWSAAVVTAIRQCAALDEDAGFLDRLAGTDFPLLLLWSNAALARRLFAHSDGRTFVSPAVLRERKSLRKAAVVCLRYALGALGRFAPRDAWIGVGFAVADGPERAAIIDRADERLRIEPDIGWIAKHWAGDARNDILAGEDAWSHVRRCLSLAPGGEVHLQTLAALEARVEALGPHCWSYAKVDGFLRETEATLRGSVSARNWTAYPHRWWLTRVVTKQLEVRASISGDGRRLYRAARKAWQREPSSRAGGAEPIGAGPFPLRAARPDPSRLLAGAEEFVDWLLDANAIAAGPPPSLPEPVEPPSAEVIHVEGRRARYKLHEPNPRRTADMIARHVGGPIRYLACDPRRVSIAPPEGMIDQRLLGRAPDEVPLGQVPPGSDAVFSFPVAAKGLEAIMARELASPRYASAPDLLPLVFETRTSLALSFGRLDARHRVWLLSAEEAKRLAHHVKRAGMLNALYRLEIHRALGSPAWLTALVAGKASRFPTGSSTVFQWLLHALRTARGPIVVAAPDYAKVAPVFSDPSGRPLAAEIYLTCVEGGGEPERAPPAA